MTREELEAALDSGRLQTRLLLPDKWYTCRRNGKTRTWKPDPERFEIPIKYRFRDCTTIRSKDFHLVDEWFRIQPEESL